MSSKALALVKPMTKSSRTQEALTTPEQLLLWYIGDCYNDEQRAAWCGNAAMARDNGLSKRRVNEITAELVRKEIIWREPRYHDVSGREMSNWWRFYDLDGEPPAEVKRWEIEHRLRGEIKAQRHAERKNGTGNPQEASAEGCEISQGEGAEERMVPGNPSQGEDAEKRMGACEISQGQGCEISQGDHAEDRMQNSYRNFQSELPHNPQGEPELKDPSEPPGGGSEENGFANAWTRMLGELAQRGVLAEPEYLRMSVETTQLRVERAGELIFLTVGFSESSASILEFYADYAHDFTDAARAIGLDPGKTRLQFQPIQKAGSA